MQDKQFGHVQITLNDVIARKGMSKNKVANLAQMQRTQLNTYCKGDIQRMDLTILARLCNVLDCTVADILEYVPPET